MTRQVELFIDPTCPFAWMTSRWLLNAIAESSEYSAKFSIMSLSVLNEGRDLDPGYLAAMERAWNPARLMLKIQQEGTQEEFAAFYTAWGERFHVGGDKADYKAVAEHALEAAGLSSDYLSIWDSEELDEALRAEQAKVEGMVGNDVGTPVISFGEGVAYFGPVLSPAPKGAKALQLLEGLYALSQVDGFYELKRARTHGIDFS